MEDGCLFAVCFVGGDRAGWRPGLGLRSMRNLRLEGGEIGGVGVVASSSGECTRSPWYATTSGTTTQGPPGEGTIAGTIRHGGDGLIELLRSTVGPQGPGKYASCFFGGVEHSNHQSSWLHQGTLSDECALLCPGHVGTFPSVPPSYCLLGCQANFGEKNPPET